MRELIRTMLRDPAYAWPGALRRTAEVEKGAREADSAALRRGRTSDPTAVSRAVRPSDGQAAQRVGRRVAAYVADCDLEPTEFDQQVVAQEHRIDHQRIDVGEHGLLPPVAV